jgi:hypothetical protein
MTVVRTIQSVIALVALVALITAPRLVGADSDPDPLSSAVATAPLSADQVVDNLVRKNQERAQAMVHCEATRRKGVKWRFQAQKGVDDLIFKLIASPLSFSPPTQGRNGGRHER